LDSLDLLQHILNRCPALPPNESMHQVGIVVPLLVRRQTGLAHTHPIVELLLIIQRWLVVRFSTGFLINVAITPVVTTANLLGTEGISNEKRPLDIFELLPKIADG
jgi:hypothetical protein